MFDFSFYLNYITSSRKLVRVFEPEKFSVLHLSNFTTSPQIQNMKTTNINAMNVVPSAIKNPCNPPIIKIKNPSYPSINKIII